MLLMKLMYSWQWLTIVVWRVLWVVELPNQIYQFTGFCKILRCQEQNLEDASQPSSMFLCCKSKCPNMKPSDIHVLMKHHQTIQNIATWPSIKKEWLLSGKCIPGFEWIVLTPWTFTFSPSNCSLWIICITAGLSWSSSKHSYWSYQPHDHN